MNGKQRSGARKNSKSSAGAAVSAPAKKSAAKRTAKKTANKQPAAKTAFKPAKKKPARSNKTAGKPPQAAALLDSIAAAPVLQDAAAAKERLGDLLGDLGKSHPLRAILKHAPARDLLAGIADHSPYLWQLCAGDPDRLAALLAAPPDAALTRCLNAAVQACLAADSDEAVMRALRKMKQEAHLLIALADIAGVWSVDRVIAAISDMADCAVATAFDYLLRKSHHASKLALPDIAAPGAGSGVFVLALGKHGAQELNYSSDVDLIVFYDPDAPALSDPLDASPLFVRVTRQMVKLLQEQTEDGYVLRVDLRLRPDPGSTAVAISLPAAFDYYESVGQNWERAAFIKARPIAGDIAVGEKFIAELTPFIWRKFFDYAAIADIHAMKRQIHAVRGHGQIAIAGHDIKLGRGGIREVEFFVQTQQLIFGGRRPQLRGRQTLVMLNELQADGWISEAAVAELASAYRLMRTIEHRLQMRIDEQTQRLPAADEEVESFARFCGYANKDEFSRALTAQMQKVENHYARLFENAPTLSSVTGSLVFTGAADDPETVETLRQLGFIDPARAIETIRGWHFGRRAAIQSARAREVLTELAPGLIEAFSGSGDPDAALAAFDEALVRMPASVELLSILKSNAPVRELFGDILGGAPRLAHVVTQRPHVLDAAIDPSLLGATRNESYFRERAARIDPEQPNSEIVLDSMRDIALEESFLIGVRMLSGAIEANEAGWQYSALATELVRVALRHVEYLFAQDHGSIPGSGVVVLGMGKLGSMEMTATSDLDLIILYDYDAEHPESDGRRSLHANQYYARLTQRLVAALTVPTRRGPLYEVDMRLRPSGRQGPIATNIASFTEYQFSEAETWEHMALTRARVLAGPEKLAEKATETIRAVIARKREEAPLKKAIRDMRQLIAREKGDKDVWDTKLVAGGLIDIEFAAQYIALRYAADNADLWHVNTQQLLANAERAGVLPVDAARSLIDGHRFYSALQHTLRLAAEGDFDPAKAPAGVLRRIAAAMQLPDFRTVEREYAAMRQQVRSTFEQLLT